MKLFYMFKHVSAVVFLVGSLSLVAEPSRAYPTLFCHGLHAGPVQAAKYIPKHTALLTGEIIVSPHATDFLSEPLAVPVFPEINLRNKKTDSYAKSFMCRLARKFDTKIYGYQIEESKTGDLSFAGRGFNIFKNNFGQQPDQDVLKMAYEAHKKAHHDKMLVWGCSRGAAAACTFMCTQAHDTKEHVQLVVLEGCFESSVSVIEKRFKRFGTKGVNAIKRFFEKRTDWREQGLSPLAVLDKWPENVPVLFVTSRKDTVVPLECTVACAKKLKELKPHVEVYLLILNNSSHSGYVFDDPADRALYEHVIHAFYKKYNWRYDPRKAALGQVQLERIKL